jgi:hypothetical protein
MYPNSWMVPMESYSCVFWDVSKLMDGSFWSPFPLFFWDVSKLMDGSVWSLTLCIVGDAWLIDGYALLDSYLPYLILKLMVGFALVLVLHLFLSNFLPFFRSFSCLILLFHYVLVLLWSVPWSSFTILLTLVCFTHTRVVTLVSSFTLLICFVWKKP